MSRLIRVFRTPLDYATDNSECISKQHSEEERERGRIESAKPKQEGQIHEIESYRYRLII